MWQIIKASVVRKDEALDRLDLVESSFIYCMNNACYKSYTRHKTLEFVQKSNQLDNQIIQRGDEKVENVEPCRKRWKCIYC